MAYTRGDLYCWADDDGVHYWQRNPVNTAMMRASGWGVEQPELSHLFDWQVEFFWRRKGGETGRAPTLAKCAKVGGIARALAPNADVVVWLAADHLREREATTYQVTGYVFHELLHTTTDEKGRLVLRGHDATLFHAELREFGLYDEMLAAAGEAFAQLRLDAGGEEAADGD